MTKLLKLGILFSTAVRAVVVAKLLILSILFLTSFLLTLRAVVVAKLLIGDNSNIGAFYLNNCGLHLNEKGLATSYKFVNFI